MAFTAVRSPIPKELPPVVYRRRRHTIEPSVVPDGSALDSLQESAEQSAQDDTDTRPPRVFRVDVDQAAGLDQPPNVEHPAAPSAGTEAPPAGSRRRRTYRPETRPVLLRHDIFEKAATAAVNDTPREAPRLADLKAALAQVDSQIRLIQAAASFTFSVEEHALEWEALSKACRKLAVSIAA